GGHCGASNQGQSTNKDCSENHASKRPHLCTLPIGRGCAETGSRTNGPKGTDDRLRGSYAGLHGSEQGSERRQDMSMFRRQLLYGCAAMERQQDGRTGCTVLLGISR